MQGCNPELKIALIQKQCQRRAAIIFLQHLISKSFFRDIQTSLCKATILDITGLHQIQISNPDVFCC